MAADRYPVRRVDVADGIEVWVSAEAHAMPEAARAWPAWVMAVAVAAAAVPAALVRLGLTAHGVLAASVLAVLALLASIDLRTRRIPNRIVVPATAVTLAWQVAFFPERSAQWVAGAVAAAALMLLPSLVRPGAIGMGDVKLAALLGAALGADALEALTIGFVAVIPAALFLLVCRGPAGVRGSKIPLGPFLAFGAAVVFLA
jgi:leader peptidase (prepilin peptidase) / N-methyltransferase